MWRDLKLDSDERPRQEVALKDFVVSRIVRLMRNLDRVGVGTVRELTFEQGFLGGSPCQRACRLPARPSRGGAGLMVQELAKILLRRAVFEGHASDRCLMV